MGDRPHLLAVFILILVPALVGDDGDSSSSSLVVVSVVAVAYFSMNTYNLCEQISIFPYFVYGCARARAPGRLDGQTYTLHLHAHVIVYIMQILLNYFMLNNNSSNNHEEHT